MSCIYAGETPPELVLRWGTKTFQHLLQFHFSPEAGSALTTSYQLWDASLMYAAPARHVLQLVWYMVPAHACLNATLCL